MAESATIPAITAEPMLGHLAEAMTAASGEAARLVELAHQGQWNLRLNSDEMALQNLAREHFGLALPVAPNTTETADGITALWLGPDEWLLTSADEAALSGKATAFQAAAAGSHIALTDLSDNRLVLELSGPQATSLLARGCGLDLIAIGTGDCAQTLFGRAQIILQLVDDAPRYRIFVRKSFADYLARFLIAEMRDL